MVGGTRGSQGGFGDVVEGFRIAINNPVKKKTTPYYYTAVILFGGKQNLYKANILKNVIAPTHTDAPSIYQAQPTYVHLCQL
jgi:hypothetical protein